MLIALIVEDDVGTPDEHGSVDALPDDHRFVHDATCRSLSHR